MFFCVTVFVCRCLVPVRCCCCCGCPLLGWASQLAVLMNHSLSGSSTVGRCSDSNGSRAALNHPLVKSRPYRLREAERGWGRMAVLGGGACCFKSQICRYTLCTYIWARAHWHWRQLSSPMQVNSIMHLWWALKYHRAGRRMVRPHTGPHWSPQSLRLNYQEDIPDSITLLSLYKHIGVSKRIILKSNCACYKNYQAKYTDRKKYEIKW